VVVVSMPALVAPGQPANEGGVLAAAAQNVLAHWPTEGRRLLVIESDCPPGLTRRVVAPLVDRWHRLGVNVALAYTPMAGRDREPQLVGRAVAGMDLAAVSLAEALFAPISRGVLRASSIEAAEAAYVLQESFRVLNTAFAEEFKDYCNGIGIQAEEVSALAATKPFGFMAFEQMRASPADQSGTIPTVLDYGTWDILKTAHRRWLAAEARRADNPEAKAEPRRITRLSPARVPQP
jgi:UDP-N-acetyl-D-mannosaminuronate dehydrogenase